MASPSPAQIMTQAPAVLVAPIKQPATKKAGHKSPKAARAGAIKPKVVGSHPPYGDMYVLNYSIFITLFLPLGFETIM